MAIAAPSTTLANPSATNPAVALATGVIQNGNGLSGPFVLDLGPSAYISAVMTTVITGAPASCTIQLQGTIDGVNWTTIATSTSTTGDTQFSSGGVQFNALQVNVSAVSGGTNPTIAVEISALSGGPVGTTVTPVGGAGLAQRVTVGAVSPTTTLAAATTGNGTTVDFGAAVGTIMFQIVPAGTITGGSVQMQISLDGVTWITTPTASMNNYSAATLANPYVLVTATNALFDVGVGNIAARYARANVSANVTGTGASVTVQISGY